MGMEYLCFNHKYAKKPESYESHLDSLPIKSKSQKMVIYMGNWNQKVAPKWIGPKS